MRYATRADLEARFGAEEIANLLDDGPDRTVQALADAASEIDGALVERYALPLPAEAAYPSLRDIACDLARERLYDDEEIEAVMRGAKRARSRLERIRTGSERLYDADFNLIPALVKAARGGPDPVFTPAALEGL